jgi:hypothetical protein
MLVLVPITQEFPSSFTDGDCKIGGAEGAAFLRRASLSNDILREV